MDDGERCSGRRGGARDACRRVRARTYLLVLRGGVHVARRRLHRRSAVHLDNLVFCDDDGTLTLADRLLKPAQTTRRHTRAHRGVGQPPTPQRIRQAALEVVFAPDGAAGSPRRARRGGPAPLADVAAAHSRALDVSKRSSRSERRREAVREVVVRSFVRVWGGPRCSFRPRCPPIPASSPACSTALPRPGSTASTIRCTRVTTPIAHQSPCLSSTLPGRAKWTRASADPHRANAHGRHQGVRTRPIIAAAARSRSSITWLYTRSVTDGSAWPSRPATVRTSTPAPINCVAVKCRKS